MKQSVGGTFHITHRGWGCSAVRLLSDSSIHRKALSGRLLLCRCEKQISQLIGVVAVIIFEQLVSMNSLFQLRDTCMQCPLAILEYRAQWSDFMPSLCVN